MHMKVPVLIKMLLSVLVASPLTCPTMATESLIPASEDPGGTALMVMIMAGAIKLIDIVAPSAAVALASLLEKVRCLIVRLWSQYSRRIKIALLTAAVYGVVLWIFAQLCIKCGLNWPIN